MPNIAFLSFIATSDLVNNYIIMKLSSNKCILYATTTILSTSALRWNTERVVPCPNERDEAYECLANTPSITSEQIPICLSCLYTEMNVDGTATFNEYCDRYQNPEFCGDIEDCVVENCVELCIPLVSYANECILKNFTAETGCDVCTVDEFVLKVE